MLNMLYLESIVYQAMSILDTFMLDSFCSVKETPTLIWIRLPLDYLLSLFRRINRLETELQTSYDFICLHKYEFD